MGQRWRTSLLGFIGALGMIFLTRIIASARIIVLPTVRDTSLIPRAYEVVNYEDQGEVSTSSVN